MIGFSSLYYSCEKETTISERDEDIAKTIESRTDGSSQTIIDILASGSSIGKDIDVRVQLNDGSITRDWSQDISSLESPILFMHEEPFIDPALPDGTCCEIKILHPYNQSGQMMIFIGEKGIDSNDGYASQFVDFDIDKIEPEQIIQFYDTRHLSYASRPQGNNTCEIEGGFGLWWTTIEPGRYDVNVDKGWVLSNGVEGVCDTDAKTFRISN